MYCSNCGKQISEGASFCTNCGAPVRRPAAPDPSARPSPTQGPVREPSPTQIPRPASAQVPRTPAATRQPAYQPPTGRQPQASGGNRGKKGGSSGAVWLIVGIVAALVVVLVAGFFILRHLGLLPFGQGDGEPGHSDYAPGNNDDSDGDSGPDGQGPEIDQYPDTVVIENFVANPEPFSGQSFALNAGVTEINGNLVRARVDAGAGTDIYLSIPAGVETVSVGDNAYVDGTYRYVGGGAGYFEGASVTCTNKPGSPVLYTDSDMPMGIKAQVTDYYKYLGAFSTSDTVDAFTKAGGPLVQLTVDGGQLRYTVSNASADLDSVAQITGSAPMDGSPEVRFYSPDDGWGNSVNGTIYLYAGGYVAVEAAVTGSGQWSMAMPYTQLVTCSGTVPVIYEPAGDCTQELRCVSSGSTAVMTLYNWDHGKWTDVLAVNASIGANGVNYNKREGDKCTPAGTFNILFAFSTQSLSTGLNSYRVSSGDVWVTDPDSACYNTYQSSLAPGKDWSSSEDLYKKFTGGKSVADICFDYNGDGLTAGSARYNGGSDLFIDGVGPNGQIDSGYGDIKITSDDMMRLLPLLDAGRHPRIVIS